MKLYELLKLVNFEDVWKCLTYTENAEPKSKTSTRRAFKELESLKPDRSEPFTIGVERITEFNGEFIEIKYYDVFCGDTNVFRWDTGEKEPFKKQSIAHLRWRLWLNADISDATLNDFTHTDIVAHCLWEMTWWGFSNRKQQQRVRTIFKKDVPTAC